jgi:hypothetical protein
MRTDFAVADSQVLAVVRGSPAPTWTVEHRRELQALGALGRMYRGRSRLAGMDGRTDSPIGMDLGGNP